MEPTRRYRRFLPSMSISSESEYSVSFFGMGQTQKRPETHSGFSERLKVGAFGRLGPAIQARHEYRLTTVVCQRWNCCARRN